MNAAQPSVLVFDVNETLIDIDSLAPHFDRTFGRPGVHREWFNQLVMYSMAITLSGAYTDFFALGQATLRMLADIHRVDVSDHDLHQLRADMLTMPAHPDVTDGLGALANHGYRLVTLTNSPPNREGPTPLEHAGLAGYFEHQFSVDPLRVFKPAPALYSHVATELGVAPTECMMVAAHVWDTIGAQAAGFTGALITRRGNAPLPVPELPQPTLIAKDLRRLAEQLGLRR
jgi:2-haloacid dehalogenase